MSDKYWYNVATGEVEHGAVSQYVDRVGPFDTAEEASGALETLKARARAWAEEEENESD